MITQFRLNSVTAHGVSGPEAGAIDIIYSYLFKEFGMSVYSYISINQIADNLDEFVSVKSKQCHINIRYSTSSDFDRKDNLGKNKVRLAVVHEALLRLADHDKKLDIEKLELIREKILKDNFNFQFVCKENVYKKDTNLVAGIVVSPHTDRFDYYIQILEKGQTICNTKIYCGRPSLIYFKDLFSIIKWNGNEEVQISGERKEAIIKLDVKSCGTEVINLTNNSFPPYFQMMRADISEHDHMVARQAWLNSLPESEQEILKNARKSYGRPLT